MSVNGAGEWQKWNDASFFGAPFIWTTLHDFGGTDGMKGAQAVRWCTVVARCACLS